MKCANCGAEIKVGCIYCSVCGHEAQIVPDYNLLEEEVLKSLIAEDDTTSSSKSATKKKQKKQNTAKNSKQTASTPKAKKKNKKPIVLIVILVLILALAVGIIVMMQIQKNHDNSFEYQYSSGVQAMHSKEYADAEKYLERAVELNEEDIDARLTLAELYETQGKDAELEAALLEILLADSNHETACEMLIVLYNEQKEYDKILALYEEDYKDTNLASLFADYVVEAPKFSEREGNYGDELDVSLTASGDVRIYYSFREYDDLTKLGKEYTQPLHIEEGETTIYAVAVDGRGIQSDVVSASYEVEFQKPSAPYVSPRSGTYQEAQAISIQAESDCTIYYTWDGSNPTRESAVYTEPLEMPVGNNILSILVVNRHGLSANISRYNYIYLPE